MDHLDSSIDGASASNHEDSILISRYPPFYRGSFVCEPGPLLKFQSKNTVIPLVEAVSSP